jgi:hypothetical protein
MKFIPSLIVAGAMALSTAASAATVVYNSNVITPKTTDYSDALSIPKFDPALGALQSIKVTLFGNLEGFVRFESLDASATTVTTNLTATLTLTRPDNTTIVVTIPAFSETRNVAAYDGVTDFAGPSGFTSPDIIASSSNFVTLTSATDLALFTGPGVLNGPLLAAGVSSATGAGNLITQFHTEAGGYASVEYTYAAVPEAATWALMLSGFGLVGIALRRREGLESAA